MLPHPNAINDDNDDDGDSEMDAYNIIEVVAKRKSQRNTQKNRLVIVMKKIMRKKDGRQVEKAIVCKVLIHKSTL